ALALGDETRRVLRLDLLYLLLGLADDRVLLRRDQHVVGGERDAAARGERVARLHQLVGEDHRLAQAAATEARVADPRDLLLLDRRVDRLERKARGQDLGKERPADGRLVADHLFHGLTRRSRVRLLQADVDLRVELDLPRFVRTLHFGDVGEHHAFALRV